VMRRGLLPTKFSTLLHPVSCYAPDSDDWYNAVRNNCNKQVRDHLHHTRTGTRPASSRNLTASPFPSARISVGADPPPATLVLSGELKHQCLCLGAYTLVAGRSAHGGPVWRHECGDMYIAQLASGNWAVQKEEKVGVTQDAFLYLADAHVMFPHQSRVAWQETDDRGRWFAGEGLKCEAVEISESKVRRAAGRIVKGNARMPGVDFEAEAADAVFDFIDVESTGVVRPACRERSLLRLSFGSALRCLSPPCSEFVCWQIGQCKTRKYEIKQRYDAHSRCGHTNCSRLPRSSTLPPPTTSAASTRS